MNADAIYIHSRESSTGGGDTPNPQSADACLTLGSLFDGSGGFPLGGLLAGITPLWASEIEPFPIRVTTKRLPSVKHLGDISAVDGAEIAPVDIITFGSPCTDMSVAGKRAGLEGPISTSFTSAEYGIFSPPRTTYTFSESPVSSTYLRRMTDAYFSSSSIIWQIRFVCSHAIIVEPLPPKVSRTMAFSWEELQIGYPSRSSGFDVGWFLFRFGLS